MVTLTELADKVQSSVEELTLPTAPKLLYAPIKYTLDSGGKRIRPLLTLAACNMFNDNIERAIPAAMSIEVFHNFTLLHDDIMDGATMRRGRDTVHVKWNDNVAILSGDAMLIYAYDLLSKSEPTILPKLMTIFNGVSRGVCEGQQYDMDFESRLDVSVDEYLMMIELKTSVLLGGAAQLGAVAGGASDEDCEKLYEFGRVLGLAFQLQDDLLDTYGDPKTFGKKIGGDIISNKKTFLLINALKLSKPEQHAKLKSLLADKEIAADAKIEAVKAIYTETGVDRLASDLVEKYFKEAIDIINSIDVCGLKKAPIIDITNTLIRREK